MANPVTAIVLARVAAPVTPNVVPTVTAPDTEALARVADPDVVRFVSEAVPEDVTLAAKIELVECKLEK